MPSAEELFDKADLNGDGSITKDELTTALNDDLKTNYPDEYEEYKSYIPTIVDQIFGSIDDGDGSITMDEYKEYLAANCTTMLYDASN